MNTRTLESGFLTVCTKKEVEYLEAAGTLINVESRRCDRGSREFVVGDRLELIGLEEYPHLNGQFVEVTAYRESDGDKNSYYIKSESGEVERWLNFVLEKRLKRRSMPTHQEVMENGATTADFGLLPTDEEVLRAIPKSESDLADKIARWVQDDIDDKNDARDAHLIAEGMRETAESVDFVIPDGIWDAMQEAFVQAIAQDTLSEAEATENLNTAMLEYFERQGEERLISTGQ